MRNLLLPLLHRRCLVELSFPAWEAAFCFPINCNTNEQRSNQVVVDDLVSSTNIQPSQSKLSWTIHLDRECLSLAWLKWIPEKKIMLLWISKVRLFFSAVVQRDETRLIGLIYPGHIHAKGDKSRLAVCFSWFIAGTFLPKLPHKSLWNTVNRTVYSFWPDWWMSSRGFWRILQNKADTVWDHSDWNIFFLPLFGSSACFVVFRECQLWQDLAQQKLRIAWT